MTDLLIVDDDAMVRNALGARFRRDPTLSASVVSSVDEALSVLETTSVDVLLTDIRMPGRDGTELLNEVRTRWPDVVRLVMSGHLDRRAWHRAAPLAHGVLDKPCSWVVLRDSVDRATTLQRRLEDSGVRDALEDLGGLPAAPRLYQALTEAMTDPGVGIADVAELVASDPAIASQVLRVANSAWLGLPRRIAGVREALSFLGVDLVRRLALSGELYTRLGARAAAAGIDVEAHQLRACLTARIAGSLAQREDTAAASTAGLLSGVGELALAATNPAKWRARATHPSGGDEADRPADVPDTSAAGALLLRRWGLPLSVVHAVAVQHAPPKGTPDRLDLAGLVYVSARFAEARQQARPVRLDPTWMGRATDDALFHRWRGAADDAAAVVLNQSAT